MEEKIGWINVTLDDIAKWGSGGTPKSTNLKYYGGNIPWLIIGDLNDNYVWKSEKKITEDGLKNSSAKIVAPENVLIAMYGSIGKLGINKIPVATNQAIAFTETLFSPTNNKYLFYYLLFSRPKLYKMGKGGTQRNISQTVLKRVDFPLAPLPEQRAIVSKIEQLFSELDNGIVNLKLAQEQLKVYRQAVLKKAFEGELTKKWREQQTNLPNAGELLEQIRKEKEEIAKNSSKKMNKINSFTEVELAEFPRLPEGWIWTKLEELGEVTGGLTKNSKRSKMTTTLPYLRVANVYSNELRLDELKYIGVEEQEIPRVLLKDGDLLVVEGNGSVDQIGRVAIWNGKISPCIHQNHIIKVRFQIVEIGKFVLFWLLSFEGRNQITKVASSTSGLYTLNISKIASLYIPLSPLPEQQAIVQEIETRLSVCDKIEQDIQTNLEKAEALRQSILKKAFEGKLLNERELAEVRGAEDWESAEVLLERIRAKRAGNE